jgi:hypothetical protein
LPELQYQHLRESVEDNQSTINLSFSSPMYAFTNPTVKKNNNSVIVPVLISYSPQMNESMTVEDLVNRDIMVKKTKVIEITLKPLYSPRDREQLLVELSRDDRVLFTYKAYLEGVLC